MFVHQTTQSGPDSQTAPPQARNTWRSCSATLFHGQHIGSAGGRVGEQFRICWFHSSVCPNRNNLRTKPDCRPYRLFILWCRFGRSGSSGLSAVFAVFVDVTSIEETAYICTTNYMSGLKVLCRLWLVSIIKLESFC